MTDNVLYAMINKLCCFSVLLLMLGCQDNTCVYYLDGSSVFAESENIRDDSTKITHYYANGNLMDVVYVVDTLNVLEGLVEKYYPDGYPKVRCVMSKGVNVSPKENGKHSGYDIKIDFGPYETLPNGRKVRPFRTFVDGVSVDEYIVAVADTGGYDFLPQKMPQNMVKYKIVYGDKLHDTSDVEVDETMYTYYLEDLDRTKMVNSNGDTCFLVYFYYKSVFNHPYPNDERMVVIRDSLNWEVTEFKDYN